ncbi:MAG: 30S ribosomal protein S16 [Candidatus Promineofilum sp.]|nr:30S ribosomal protein S16 [Promineifilum sp.]
MLRIRLSRTGKIRQPSYRVVVAEKEDKRDGRIVENIGHYNPLPNPAEYMIKEDRALYWLSVGAQPTDAVRVLLEKQGTMGRLTRLHAGESLDALVTEYTGVAPAAAKTKDVAETVVDKAKDVVETVVDKVEEVADKAEDVAEAAVDKVQEAAEAVADEAEAVVEKVEDAAEAVADKVEDVAEAAVDEAKDIVEGAADKVEEAVEAATDGAGEGA